MSTLEEVESSNALHYHIKSNKEPSNKNLAKDNLPNHPTKDHPRCTYQGQPPSHSDQSVNL